MNTDAYRSSSAPAAVIVFLKAPVKGFVKTRLAGTIGDDAALRLYRQLVRGTFGVLSKTALSIRAYAYPAGELEKARELTGPHTLLLSQRGDDLGAKMKNAFHETFAEGFEKAILVGTDIPGLTGDILHQAVIGLNDYPAVLGPSVDGGYYLIGFHVSGFAPEVFADIPWGTPDVFFRTRNRFADRGVAVHILPECRDIDTYEDLLALVKSDNASAGEYENLLAAYLM